MQVLPIDLTALLAVFMGCLIVLTPIAGLTLRFALKPMVDALGRWSEMRGSRDAVELLGKRVAFLEQQLETLESTVQRLAEVSEFDRQLAKGERAVSPLESPRWEEPAR